jgi:hypothetical protein
MTEHTKTDGLPGMDMPVVAEAGSGAFGKAPPRNERMSTAKVECNACPVLCQISDGRTGACDRYANREGVLVRVDPVVLLRRTIESEAPALVPFNRTGAETAPAPAEPDWNGDLLHADEVFVTGVGSSTTYPDYKPAPFIVASKAQGVDMVTVVTEGIFSYCSFKVKIDTDRFLGSEQANVRYRGEVVGHVTTAEYGSQMLSLGGVHHLTGGSKKEGRMTAELMQLLGNKKAVECTIDGGSTLVIQAGKAPIVNGVEEQCAWAAAPRRSASSRASSRAWPTKWWWSTTTSPACSPSTRLVAASTWRPRASRCWGASPRRGATSRWRTRATAGAAPTSPIRSRSSRAGKRASRAPACACS